MGIISLHTSAQFLHSSNPFLTTAKHGCSTTTYVSLSVKPPPPEEPNSNPAESSTSVRRPNALKATPILAPKVSKSKNPLRNRLLTPSYVPNPPPPNAGATTTEPTKTTSSYALSTKLRLSSKLSPPPPPPPPPPPAPQETQIRETISQENQVEENEQSSRTEFRQEGKVFVGNLPSWIKKHEVSEVFRQFGPIKNVILIKGHNETERNAGFGFVIYDGAMANKSAAKAVEFDGMEFHGKVLTVKLDDGRRLKAKSEERKRWVLEGGAGGEEYRSKWHESRDRSRKAFQKVLETQPENWQAVVTAFERINKVRGL